MEDFKKVYCDLCEQKIYLEDFPYDWNELTAEDKYEYLNQQIAASDGYDSLAGWRDNDQFNVEDWVLICKRCGNVES